MSAETFVHFVTTRCDGRTDRQTDGRLDDRLEDASIECSAVKTANVSATAVKHELEAVYAAIGQLVYAPHGAEQCTRPPDQT